MSAPLLVAEQLTVTRGTRVILDNVSLGVHVGDRIGIVGRNGSGKTTLLRLLAGLAEPDSGKVTPTSGISVALVSQVDALPGATAGEVLVGDRPEHEWASDPVVRAVLTGLLGGLDARFLRAGMATAVAGLSGGERRRIALAAALIRQPDVLLLDEPTNHLDIEAVRWLADHLNAWPAGRRALVVVTHDRWLLDAVTTQTWQVHDGRVAGFEGGYAAYVLAKAERDRIAAATAAKRDNLLRKELAWLRRGAPARTSKPKFRVDAAEALIADEPPPRDTLALHRVASARLGRTVIDAERLTVSPAAGMPPVLDDTTWALGPGDRIGLLGPNGAGKTTLLRLLRNLDPPPHDGFLRRGKTVQPAIVGQQLAALDAEDRVLPWLTREGEQITVTSGAELTPAKLLELFGFTGDAPWKRLGDLSGGERRRLELLRTLLSGANLLMLDEPTNDLDIETLQVLEDVLDGWPGTLLVVSHDRYFLERVCDDVWAMLGDGKLRHLPGGVDEYLRLRQRGPAPRPAGRAGGAPTPATVAAGVDRATPAGQEPGKVAPGSAEDRALRKELARIERALDRLHQRKARLHEQLAEAATDPDRLLTLTAELRGAEAEEAELEAAWLEAGDQLDG